MGAIRQGASMVVALLLAGAVNATVVLSVVLLFAANVIVTELSAALVPRRLG